MKPKIINFISPFSVIAAAVLLRLVPHEPNVAPIGAMALFGGSYLPKKYALPIPILTMFVSDIFLGFHNTIAWVYGSFILIGLIGMLLKNRVNPGNVLLASLASSVLFYLITNFGVWFNGSMYPKTLSGLLQSYVLALPFFRNTLLGDLFYSGVFFGGYALVRSRLTQVAHSEVQRDSG